MLAGKISAPGHIELIDIEEPRLAGGGPGGEILFEPELACLCGSDLPFFTVNGEWGDPLVGHSLHEMIGRVVETSGTRFRPDQRVLAVPEFQQGLFERYVLTELRAIPLDPRVPDDQAVMAQPLGTVLYALKKLPNLLDLDVAIVGAGPIGQLFCAAVRNLGAREIISIDLLPDRLEVARKMGATTVVAGGDADAVEDAVREATGGQLADVVIEAIGHQDQQLNLCIRLCRQGGKLLSFGVPPETLDGLQWRELFRRNINVITSVEPDFDRDFPLAMRFIAEGRIDVKPIITHRFPLAKIQDAFDLFHQRRDGALKVLIDFPAGERRLAGQGEFTQAGATS